MINHNEGREWEWMNDCLFSKSIVISLLPSTIRFLSLSERQKWMNLTFLPLVWSSWRQWFSLLSLYHCSPHTLSLLFLRCTPYEYNLPHLISPSSHPLSLILVLPFQLIYNRLLLLHHHQKEWLLFCPPSLFSHIFFAGDHVSHDDLFGCSLLLLFIPFKTACLFSYPKSSFLRVSLPLVSSSSFPHLAASFGSISHSLSVSLSPPPLSNIISFIVVLRMCCLFRCQTIQFLTAESSCEKE